MENRNQQNIEQWLKDHMLYLKPIAEWKPDTDRALDRLHALDTHSRTRQRRNLWLTAGCCSVAIALSALPSTRSAARAAFNKIFVWQVEGRLNNAPDFQLEDIAGGKIKAAELKGKVSVVDFWATWCEPCIAEIPEFNQLHEQYPNVQVIGIAVMSLHETIKPKVEETGMKYTVLVGNDDVTDGFGGLIGFPTTFVVTKDWKIYKKYLGALPNKQDRIKEDIEKLLADGKSD